MTIAMLLEMSMYFIDLGLNPEGGFSRLLLGMAWLAIVAVAGKLSPQAFILGVSTLFTLLRFHLYLVEVLVQCAAFLVHRVFGRNTLRFCPVLYDDLCRRPLPFLEEHLVRSGDADPELAWEVLESWVSVDPHELPGRTALLRLQAKELERFGRERAISSVAELEGNWLHGFPCDEWDEALDDTPCYFPEEDPELDVRSFQVAARLVMKARAMECTHEKLGCLEEAEATLVEPKLMWGECLAAPRKLWRTILEEERSEIAGRAFAPPWRNDPLTPESGTELFRGRKEQVRSIRSWLSTPEDPAPMVLVGPRRCGKTSLVRMLSYFGDTVCVRHDLRFRTTQMEPCVWISASEAWFPQALKRPASVYSALFAPTFSRDLKWLGSVKKCGDTGQILICIDDFEKLEVLLAGSEDELHQLLAFFARVSQHQDRVRVLLSGERRIDELGSVWRHHLAGARQVGMGYLDREAVIGLLTKPVETFPEGVIPREVAEAVFERTNGQPYLVQLYGAALTERARDERLDVLGAEDVAKVEGVVLRQAGGYFREMYESAPEEAQAALDGLADGAIMALSENAERWLRRHLLITEDGALRVPVLGRWIRDV